MESDQKLEQIKAYYADKGLNIEVLSKLAAGFFWTIGYGAEYIQNEEE